MAKGKRKISSAQRDKSNIQRAKKLKEAGIISKQAKLHGGKFISKEVLAKVRQFKDTADLGYKAVAVPKKVAKAAQERGFQVVQGNKIIGPKTRTFTKRLKEGKLTGVRPVKGGMMEEVILPHTVYDMRSLVEQLSLGIDTLKLPEEQFAFKYHGAESYRAFMNTQQLLEYLRHYKGFANMESAKPEDLQEEFSAFTIFRLHPNTIDQNIRGVRQRQIDKQRERMEKIKRGEYVPRKRWKSTSRYDKAARMTDARAKKFLEKEREKDKQKRERIMQDPSKLAEYREAARRRAKASRERNKK